MSLSDKIELQFINALGRQDTVKAVQAKTGASCWYGGAGRQGRGSEEDGATGLYQEVRISI